VMAGQPYSSRMQQRHGGRVLVGPGCDATRWTRAAADGRPPCAVSVVCQRAGSEPGGATRRAAGRISL